MLSLKQLFMLLGVRYKSVKLVVEEYLISFAINFIAAIFQLASPFLVKSLIDYITTPDEPLSKGIIFVVALVVT